MGLSLPEAKDLINESDVEPKFILPLLVAQLPDGFALGLGDIQTKANIRRFRIGKGAEEKLYFPD